MKFKFIYALAIAGALSTFSSCSNDDDPAPGSSLEQKTYSSNDGLTLNLNGAPLIGKTATFTPGTDGKATVTLAGEPLDISQIMGMITRADDEIAATLPTAGVLPGSPSVSIPVELNGDANNCSFQGTNETEYCTYSYSGSVTADNFEFNLSDVKLKNTSLVGSWTVPALDDSFYNVGRVNWKSGKGIDLSGSGTESPIENVVALIFAFTNIQYEGESVPVLEMLSEILQNVTFKEDGTLTAEYVDTETWETTTAPAGIAQYVITSEGNIRLYLNPMAIIANTLASVRSRSSRAIDFNSIVGDLLTQLIPMLSNGIPLKYGSAIADNEGNLNEDSNVKSFYLDTDTLLPILKAIAPIFEDKDFINSIVEEAAKDPVMGGMAGTILPNALKTLPEVIEKTTKVEIGINLQK